MEITPLAVLISGIIVVVAIGSFVVAALLFFSTFFNKELKEIKQLLNNHISETNKKIDKLESNFEKRMDKFEREIKELVKSVLNQNNKDKS